MQIHSVGIDLGKTTSMISLCQAGRGFPVALKRAPGCSTERVHLFAVVPLGAVRITQNQTSIRCIRSFGPSQKIE